MTTYKPYGISELRELLAFAQAKGLPVLTRHQRQEGVGIDFQYWNEIMEIDAANMMVTVGRAVHLGDLEDALSAQGLHFGPVTEDLRTMTIGDFYCEQVPQLSSGKQSRYLVQGLEVLLSNGEVVKAGGKTVKNVSGYDMCRFYISNRESLAIPLHFTLRVESAAKEQESYLLEVPEQVTLAGLVQQLRYLELTPAVCLCWDNGSLAALEPTVGDGQSLFVMLQGSQQQLVAQRKKLEQLTVLDLTLHKLDEEQQAACWRLVRDLRGATTWSDGCKIPTLQADAFVAVLRRLGIGFWYLPLQGNYQLLAVHAERQLYHNLQMAAEQLGGVGNAYYALCYGLAHPAEIALWHRFKEQLDPADCLNPLEKAEALSIKREAENGERGVKEHGHGEI